MSARMLTAQAAAAVFMACIACSPLQAQLYTTDFTTAEDAAWSEGGDLNDSSAWNAQPAWDTADVAGDGFATVSTAFSRAINTSGGFMMDVGDIVELNLTLNILGTWDLTGNNNLLALGLTEDFGSGTATTRVGAGIRANEFADTLNLRDQVFTSGNTVAFDWAEINDDGDFDQLDWTVTITKTPTLNEFLVETIIRDTEGANQNSGNTSFTITSSDLYGAASVFPMIRAGGEPAVNGLTGLQVDTFRVTIIPEPSVLLLTLVGLVPLAILRRRRQNG